MKRVAILLLVALFVLPCAVFAGAGKESGTASGTGGGAATTAVPTKFKESPMLADLVKQGKLPPLEERLPEKPLVYTQEWNEIPSEDMTLEIGKYGGTMRLADPSTESGAAPETWCFSNEPPLVSPGIDTIGEWRKGKLRGNWLESWENNKDFTEFTFRIRKGLKWSDGVPVTTDDVDFRINHVFFNEVLNPTPPLWLKVNQVATNPVGSLQIVDQFTFKLKFPSSYPLLPAYLGLRWNNPDLLIGPKHYLQQFHIDYTSLDKMKAELEKNSFKEGEWNRLYALKATWPGQQGGAAVGCPNLQPWIYKGQPAQGIFVFERNPYYYKVDASGQQLPYIDKVEVHWVTDLKGQTMKIIAGEVDYSVNRTNVTDYPLFKENEAKGKYKVDILKQHVTPTDAFLNMTYPDPVWRQVVRNPKFRQALNMGIDRKRIMEVVQQGYGSLPSKAKVPFDFNPTRAKQLLDEMGLNKKDADGWRLGPDGKRFVIPFEQAVWTTGADKVAELVAQMWQDLGIFTTLKVLDMGLVDQRRNANDIRAQIFWMDWAVIWEENPTAWSCSMNQLFLDMGPVWAQWYLQQGKVGEEPPAEVMAFIKGIETVQRAVDDQERIKATAAVYKNLYDNIWFFPIAESGYPMVHKMDGNMPVKTRFGISAAYSAEQFFYK